MLLGKEITSIYFKTLVLMEQREEVKNDKDIKECLETIVNDNFWNMSDSFKDGLVSLLTFEYDLYKEQVEQLRKQRIATLEKARLIKKAKQAGKQVTETKQANKQAMKVKKTLLKDGLKHDELLVINGVTYKAIDTIEQLEKDMKKAN